MEIKEYDLIELNKSGWFYQVQEIDNLIIRDEEVISEPTLVYDYEDCPDTWYSYVRKVEDVKHRISAIYRKVNGELKLIWKK